MRMRIEERERASQYGVNRDDWINKAINGSKMTFER